MNLLANAALRHATRWFIGAEIRWEMRRGSGKIRGWCYGLAGMLLLALPASAQMEVGDYLRMNLNGNVGFNYGGSMNQGLSTHSMGFSGNGFLTGSYYSPNFLNFNVNPFYNREQSNTIYGALTNAEGVSSNLNLFTGSHFPGSISYNRLANGSNAYGIPGSDIGLAQNSDSQGFGVSWGVVFPEWPTLTASYGTNSASNTIYGQQGSNDQKDQTINLTSTYRVDGFHLGGQITHRKVDLTSSELLSSGLQPVQSNSASTNYQVTADHALPLTGDFAVSFNHLSYGYDYKDSYTTSNSGDSNLLNANASFHPEHNLSVSFVGNYDDSVLGAVPQTMVNNGSELNMKSLGSLHTYLVGSGVYYQAFKNLGFSATVNHSQQSFLGQDYSATQFGGSANFNFDHSILQGLTFSVSAVDTAQQQSNTGLGFVGNVNYSRKILGWDVGANFSYAQNVQTVLLVQTTSSYTYLGNLRRRIGLKTNWMVGYNGAHSGFTASSGMSSSADRFWSTAIYGMYTLNGYYTKSSGLAILTSTGLVPIPTNVPGALFAPGATASYSSHGYGFNLGMTPIKRLTLSGAFAKSSGETIDPNLSIFTNTQLINALMQYRLRKIFVNAGYTRLRQAVGTPGSTPIALTSYYVGFSRWFNFF